jgi:hypothetical protein
MVTSFKSSTATATAKQQQRHEPDQIPYSVSLRYNPTVPKLGQSTLITIKIVENQTEKRVKEFNLLHEKLIHVIIVSEDLSHFSHIHPAFDIKDGIFSVYNVFPEGRRYKIWIDFKPMNKNHFSFIPMTVDIGRLW